MVSELRRDTKCNYSDSQPQFIFDVTLCFSFHSCTIDRWQSPGNIHDILCCSNKVILPSLMGCLPALFRSTAFQFKSIISSSHVQASRCFPSNSLCIKQSLLKCTFAPLLLKSCCSQIRCCCTNVFQRFPSRSGCFQLCAHKTSARSQVFLVK